MIKRKIRHTLEGESGFAQREERYGPILVEMAKGFNSGCLIRGHFRCFTERDSQVWFSPSVFFTVSLFHYLHNPPPPFLHISLMVSVDVKQHVYFAVSKIT